MTRGEEGLWSVTVGPLEPDLYSYHFLVDGALTIDPKNRVVKKWENLGIDGRSARGQPCIVACMEGCGAWDRSSPFLPFTGDRFTALHAGLHASCLPVGC